MTAPQRWGGILKPDAQASHPLAGCWPLGGMASDGFHVPSIPGSTSWEWGEITHQPLLVLPRRPELSLPHSMCWRMLPWGHLAPGPPGWMVEIPSPPPVHPCLSPLLPLISICKEHSGASPAVEPIPLIPEQKQDESTLLAGVWDQEAALGLGYRWVGVSSHLGHSQHVGWISLWLQARPQPCLPWAMAEGLGCVVQMGWSLMLLGCRGAGGDAEGWFHPCSCCDGKRQPGPAAL